MILHYCPILLFVFIHITFVTYCKGLTPAIDELLSEVEHRMCARHIWANWAKKWRGARRKKKTFKVELKNGLEELNKSRT